MMNKFGPCAVMAYITRMVYADNIEWEIIDGEYAADGVRLWREGNPSEHFDVFPDYEECEYAEDDELSFFFVTYADDSTGFAYDYNFEGASPRRVAEEVFAAMQAELFVS